MRTYYSYPAIESAYETVQDEGSSLPQQTILDFQGAGVTVTDGGTKTIVTIPGGGGTPAALTKTDDTNVTLTLGGTPATALLQAVSLTVGWTGTLADARIASAAAWNAKQNAITGAATTITTLDLTASRVLVSDASGKVAANSVTATTLSYLDATSSIQTQINSKSEKSILLFSSALNPADSSDYYFSIGYVAATTSPSQKRFKFESGSTTAIKLALQMGNTVAGSSELVTLNLRNQTTTTDYLIGTFDMSLVATNTNYLFEFVFSQTINTTDQWTIKMTTPAWVTNPTSVAMQLKLYYK